MSLYLAAYDLASNARRSRVARVLESYGRRIQDSVFEVWVDPDEIRELRVRLGVLLHANDSFDLWPVDERGTRRRISWQRTPDDWGSVIEL